jgi:electron transfer flavoprotein beta subunit
VKIVVLLRRLRARPDGATASRPIGACDEAALAAALALEKALAGSTVIALGAGLSVLEDEALRLAVACGADKAVRVDDPTLVTVDYHGMGRALGAAAKHLGAELVVCGDRSEDEVQGAVGPAVAEAMGIAHVTGARDLRAEAGGIVLTRRETGLVRTLRIAPPAVLTVASQRGAALAPAAPSGPPPAVTVLDLGTLGLQAAELKHRDRLVGRAHPVRLSRNATLVDAGELVARLRDDHLLG